MNKIQAELTIVLERVIKKTEERPKIIREYRFSLPVGAEWSEAIAFSKEMTTQVEAMKKRSEEASKAKEEAKDTSTKDTSTKDTSVENTSVKDEAIEEVEKK